METEHFLNIINIEQFKIKNIVTHRVVEDHHEYLFSFMSPQGHIGRLDIRHIENMENVGDNVHYQVWLKDNFDFDDMMYFLSYEDSFSTTFRDQINIATKKIVNKIYSYCCRKNIKVLYCTIHRLTPSEDFINIFGDRILEMCEANYNEQLESLRYFRKIYPEHKVVFKDSYYNEVDEDLRFEVEDLRSALKFMRKGDIFYTFNPRNQKMKEYDIMFFKNRLNKNRLSETEKRTIKTTFSRTMEIEEVISIAKEHDVSIVDFNFYKKKISAETIALATNDRIAENSSLKVLPRHLIRQICTWF